MLKPIIFWGASGHALVLQEFIGSLGYGLTAIFDNQEGLPALFPDVPQYCGRAGFKEWRAKHATQPTACLVAIGRADGRIRLELQRFLEAEGLTPIVAVHPTAFVAASATLGDGSQVLAQGAVAVAVRAGAACIINTSASVDHESRLGDGVHIGPGASLCGCVTIGDHTMIGAGAVVLPRITVGRDVIVGAGAVVTKDVPDNQIVCGNPARPMREKK